jgi:hypothetical protein
MCPIANPETPRWAARISPLNGRGLRDIVGSHGNITGGWMYADTKSERTSSGLIRLWYVVSARSSTCAYASTSPSASRTNSDRAPFGVAVVANACGFGVAVASADGAGSYVTRGDNPYYR